MKNAQNTNRRQRYRVSKNPPPIQLTLRDKKLLKELYIYRLLTTNQIQKLIFPATEGKSSTGQLNSCRRRLAKLFHNHYVSRLKLPFFPTEGSVEIVYVLGKLGAEIVSQKSGIDIKTLKWKYPTSKLSYLWVNHALHVNQVRIAFNITAIEPQFEIKEWLDERALEQRRQHFGVNQMTLKRIPDAYFVVHNKVKNTLASFFLEVDRGTESQSSKLTYKIQAYTHYCFSGRFKQDFGLNTFRLLFIVDSQERLANLVKLETSSNFVLATSMDKMSGNPLIDAIWQEVGQTEELKALYKP